MGYAEQINRLRAQTLEDAKGLVQAGLEDGIHCPCCGQYAKSWKKCIISTAAVDLIRLVRRYDGSAVHLDEFTCLPKDRNFSQLALWGLIRPEVNTDTSKRASGMWHPTERGIGFAGNRITVAKYVITYNNEVLGFESPQVSIQDVLGQKFDYEQLMRDNYD